MAEKRYLYEVIHPELGAERVEATTAEGATLAAARKWDEPWREIACDCRVRKLGTAQERRCRRCNALLGAEQTAGFCTSCTDLLARQRQAARRLEKDTRAGMRRK